MNDKVWANEYLQQANVIKIQIKQIKLERKSVPEPKQSGLNARIYILYQMYLDCKHVGEFLDKRAQVQAVIEQERRKAANGKTSITFGYIDREHSWSTAVSISE